MPSPRLSSLTSRITRNRRKKLTLIIAEPLDCAAAAADNIRQLQLNTAYSPVSAGYYCITDDDLVIKTKTNNNNNNNNNNNDNRESAFLLKRLSVLIQRFNSVAIRGTFAHTPVPSFLVLTDLLTLGIYTTEGTKYTNNNNNNNNKRPKVFDKIAVQAILSTTSSINNYFEDITSRDYDRGVTRVQPSLDFELRFEKKVPYSLENLELLQF